MFSFFHNKRTKKKKDAGSEEPPVGREDAPPDPPGPVYAEVRPLRTEGLPGGLDDPPGPVYAEVRPLRTEGYLGGLTEPPPPGVWTDSAGYAVPGVATTMRDSGSLNYTQVVFNDSLPPVEKSEDRKGPPVRRHNVEYTEINPRPLPKMPQGKGPQTPQDPPSRAPRYANITCRDQSDAPFEPEQTQTDTSRWPSPNHPTTRRHDRQDLDIPIPSSEEDPSLLHDRLAASVPVPKPRRSPKVHTYENRNLLPPTDVSPSPAPRVLDTSHAATSATAGDAAVRKSSVTSQRSLDGPTPPHSASPLVVRHRTMAHATTPLEFSQGMNAIDNLLIQLPPVPGVPSPTLPADAAIWWQKLPEIGDSNMVESLWDFDGIADDQTTILAFKKGDTAVVVRKETNGWIGVKIGDRNGWVPAQYWGPYQPRPHKAKRNIKTIKQAESLYENKAWFVGKMGRQESEDLLLTTGKQCDFLIRESTNRVGALTLSVRYLDRARHFPIERTPNGKYDIGKHHFTDLTRVVAYYQSHPLFYDEDETPVSLGNAINKPDSP